jgi:hypothetical protein
VPLSPFLEANERGGINCLMNFGVTVIADGKSLVQNYFMFTSINKVSQILCFLSAAAEKYRQSSRRRRRRRKRRNLLTVMLIWTKMMKTVQIGNIVAAGAETVR